MIKTSPVASSRVFVVENPYHQPEVGIGFESPGETGNRINHSFFLGAVREAKCIKWTWCVIETYFLHKIDFEYKVGCSHETSLDFEKKQVFFEELECQNIGMAPVSGPTENKGV